MSTEAGRAEDAAQRPPGAARIPAAPYAPAQRGPYLPPPPYGVHPAPAPAPPQPPAPSRRPARRAVAAAVCAVLGVGLLGGALTGRILADGTSDVPPAAVAFDQARSVWHSERVDALFPPRLTGEAAGPGGADRRWTRVAVAPDSTCRGAFDPELAETLSTVGCARLVRATYADETTSALTTVGVMVTETDRTGMERLRDRLAADDLARQPGALPRPFAARGTVSAGFGDAQRATWTVRALTDAPLVVYAVTGFADGRAAGPPVPAAEATEEDATSVAALSGLAHDAQGIAERVEAALRRATQPAADADAEDTE